MKEELLKLAAIFCGGMTMTLLTACSNSDTVAHDGDPDYMEDYVTPPTQPTEDALQVKLADGTYVFSGNYTGEAKALIDRVTVPVASLPDGNVANIIIHNNSIPFLKNNETAYILLYLSRGAALIVADPTAENMKLLAGNLRSIISFYSHAGNDEEVRRIVLWLRDFRILDHIFLWTDNYIDAVFQNSQTQGNGISLLALRDEDSYVSFNLPQTVTYTMPVVTYDEKGNVLEEKTVTSTDDLSMNAYQYGEKADNVAQWLNTGDEDPSAEAASRRLAAELMATRAGGEAEAYIDKIAESIDKTYDVGFQLSGPQGHNPYHTCKVKYRIWTAYSGEKKCDVYCVTQEVTAYNQQLKCGPSDEEEWYNGENWGMWKALDSYVSGLRKDVYGPYMKLISTECQLVDGNHEVTLEQYAPQNSTTGGQNVSNGFSYSLGGSVSLKQGGPEASVSGSMSWSTSVSRFDGDLVMTTSPTPAGKVAWTYTSPDPDAHFSLAPWKHHTHEFPRSIQVNTCTIQQAWVWTVKSSESSSVYMQPVVKLEDHWLCYDRAPKHIGQCYPHYISQYNNANAIPKIVFSCPPRYRQTWSMSVESDDVSADKLKEIESYLSTQLSQYFLTSSILFTVKPEHKTAQGLADSDEIQKFVYKCKQAFTNNNNVIEILRQAGKRGGVPDTGSYTIVWRQTDVDANSDREEFTFHMSK